MALVIWKIVAKDNKYTTAGGATTAVKFINEDGVDLIMHQTSCDPAMGAYPYAEEANIIVDTTGGYWDLFGPERRYLFQVAGNHI